MDDYTRWLRSRVGTALIKGCGAGAVVKDSAGQILLIRRSDNGLWGITGGGMVPGEGALACAEREILEESGYRARITGLLGVYSDPTTMRHTYPNGDQVEVVAITYEAMALERIGTPDRQSLAVRFFAPHELPTLEEIQPADQQMILDAISSLPRPFLR